MTRGTVEVWIALHKEIRLKVVAGVANKCVCVFDSNASHRSDRLVHRFKGDQHRAIVGAVVLLHDFAVLFQTFKQLYQCFFATLTVDPNAIQWAVSGEANLERAQSGVLAVFGSNRFHCCANVSVFDESKVGQCVIVDSL